MSTDLRVDDRVYLTPKTKAPPAICYQQPAAVVVGNVRGPMVTVLVDGEDATRDIHRRNLTKTAPVREQPERKVPMLPAVRKLTHIPDDMEEVTLW